MGICQFLEAVLGLKGSSGTLMLETPCQVALITTYVHHSELAVTSRARTLLLRLRQHMRRLLQAEKDCIGLNMAGFLHLQRMLKNTGGFAKKDAAPTAQAGRDVKKTSGQINKQKRKR